MRKAIVLALATSLALVVPAGVAVAGDRDVIQEGPCSTSSDWKLKLSPEDGRIEVRVRGPPERLRRPLAGQDPSRRRPGLPRHPHHRGASGSFEVRIVEDDRAGADTFRARARSFSTAEVCSGSATF